MGYNNTSKGNLFYNLTEVNKMLEDLEFFEQIGLGEQYQDFMKEWRDSLELYRTITGDDVNEK